MSESSGEPPNPSSANPSEAASSPQNHVTRAPRANPASVFNPKDAPKAPGAPTGAPPGFAEFMSWMQSLGGGAQEETPTGRALIPKEQKKFSRRPADAPPNAPGGGDTPLPPMPGGDGTPGEVAEGETAVGAPAQRRAPVERFDVQRKRRSKDAPARSPVVVIVMQMSVFGLLIASFFLGRATVPKTAAPVPMAAPALPGSTKGDSTPGVLPAELQAKVEEALRAQSSQDFKRAEALLQEVEQQGGRVHGLTYAQAQLAYFEGDFPRVLPLLNRSIAAGEEVAAAYNLRGTLANRKGGISKGINDLELATQLDPFDARFAFFAGGALRRMGKPQTAAEYLRRALDCLHEPLLEGFYTMKLDLALLEAGQEKEFADDLAAKLALNPPSVDTLFTAAAVELHRGRLTAAAAYLDRARTLTTQEEMNLRLQDYYFYGFNDNQELARFFASMKGKPEPAAPAESVPTASPSASPTLELPNLGDLPRTP